MLIFDGGGEWRKGYSFYHNRRKGQTPKIIGEKRLEFRQERLLYKNVIQGISLVCGCKSCWNHRDHIIGHLHIAVGCRIYQSERGVSQVRRFDRDDDLGQMNTAISNQLF